MGSTTTTWLRVFRDGIAPQLSANHLNALRSALVRDDPALLQGATVCPPALQCVEDWPVEGGDAIAYMLHKADGLNTVGEVEAAWGRICIGCDARLGEPGSVRYFLNWYDDAPREQMRIELLAVIHFMLAERSAAARPVAEEPKRVAVLATAYDGCPF